MNVQPVVLIINSISQRLNADELNKGS